MRFITKAVLITVTCFSTTFSPASGQSPNSARQGSPMYRLAIPTSKAREALERGMVLAQKGDIDAAIRAWSEAIRLAPNDPAAYLERATAYAVNGDSTRSMSDLNEVLRLDPLNVRALNNRGMQHRQNGDLDSAFADFTSAISADREYTRAYYNRASVLMAKGNADAAIRDYDEALRLDPTAPGYVDRGNAHLQKEDPKRALADFELALRMDLRNIDAQRGRGFANAALGNVDQAITDFNSVIRRDPSAWVAYMIRGNAYLEKGNPDLAIRDLDEAIRLNPQSVDAFLARGAAFKRKGQLARAISDYDQANRLNPNDAAVYSNRAIAYRELGDLPKALADFEAALKIDPGFEVALEERRKVAEIINKTGDQFRTKPSGQPTPVASGTLATSSTPQTATALAVSPTLGTRVALVIGNSDYTSVPRLPNPSRDAATVAQAFREAGFKTVQVRSDLSYEAMRRALRDFSAEAEKADWAVVYYAGHGIEVSGQNYLVPVDAQLKNDRDVQFEAVPLDQVLATLEGSKRLRLVILDACRDNPFINQMTRSVASRSIGRGLARIEPEGGTLVAYAAKAGQVALDGEGQNSPFVSALVKHISTPGVEISKLFRLVRDDVLAATGKAQEPFVYGSLPGEDFFFKLK